MQMTHEASRNSTPELPQAFLFFFSKEKTDGHKGLKNLLGGKGANLAEMTRMGLPVPPGFTISTEICSVFNQCGGQLPEAVASQVRAAVQTVEQHLQLEFGNPQKPLLFSVRSGARVSMPGMMDTILNLGLNDDTAHGLAELSGNPEFAWDSYRRFVQMYSNVVMGMNSSLLEAQLEDLKAERGVHDDSSLTADDLKNLVGQFKKAILLQTGLKFPESPWEQLWGAIGAVFRSWNTPRAKTYRELHQIPHHWGTAVNVQAMVFGNMGDDCATGVAFTRNPSTGAREIYGEFLVNAQGEDVVAGIRTPQPITRAAAESSGLKSLEEQMPQAFAQLVEVMNILETHYRDMQDIEFTIQKNQLWMLQTRSGKRTARAALRLACEMVAEGLISRDEALLRVDAKSLDQLLHPSLDPDAAKTQLARGLPASPGGASGQIVFSAEAAVAAKGQGIKSILVRIETSPEDIEGMVAAEGILTTRGGMTSHAAVVARGMGKCCVAGCGDIEVDYVKQQLRAQGFVLKAGDVITLDGGTGQVFLGEIPTVAPQMDAAFVTLMSWADQARKLKVRTNADTPVDAQTARGFGAEGIGLCRTEHMFFAPDRIDHMRAMIVAEDSAERESALAELLPFQRADFSGIFEAMAGLPVTIRLLDPPLHEFLPHDASEVALLAQRLKMSPAVLSKKMDQLHEFNPMLGHRGCRLAITYPEIYRMQAQAIAEAACDLKKQGVVVLPEIMLPLIATEEELTRLRALVERTVAEVQQRLGTPFDYTVGTMIELPRAAIVADRLAAHADFFSFGTNDLTQTTMGLSRDDSGRFLGTYVSESVLPYDPFQSLDQDGVGELVRMACHKGRATRPQIKLGICGEHGGDPLSIHFFAELGLDYVSCSPFRVPVARLAAAQAALKLASTQQGLQH